MRFFIDTEFLEDGLTIELISIGIVRGDGQEYYAETYAMHHPEIGQRIREHEWLMENVVPHLSQTDDVLRTRSDMAKEIRNFTTCHGGDQPEFWANCGAYDWVVLNQQYGSMVDHLRQWPFYCNDIQQYALHLGINRRTFPPQESAEHNALADARWTRDTWEWLKREELGQEIKRALGDKP